MNRNSAADVLVGFAHDSSGRGLAYAAIADGSGRGVVRVPFSATPLARYDGLEFGYAAVAALGAELRKRGFARIRLRLGDERVVHDLASPAVVPPALGMPYVRARCALNGFASARVERADPREIADLEGRARAELQLRTAA
ncbi:MAG TPA: hypothetical protein VGP41_09005 [Candidatus Lustribacter sp.]|nr:hypothetical protein [Candidatus Lustribacter sp.]